MAKCKDCLHLRVCNGLYFNLDKVVERECGYYQDKSKFVEVDREVSELVFDILDLIHEFDWYKSGDTCKENYLKAKADFKNKWLGNRGVRVRRIVDEALKQCKDELYETFGLPEDKWQDNADSYKCPYCDYECNNPNYLEGQGKFCPKCGKQLRWNV